mmetsp:Transcript_17307/g.34568  ORF Transcript_17307/g.34568 Transcript_17307/m.34568 type:complete len:218 (+) Transcript_17307:70-723(+)
MTRSSANDDPRFRKAVRKIIENTTVTVPDAMKCADFKSDEIKNKSLNQRIRRAAAAARGGQKPSSIVVDPSMMSFVSTVTATPPLKTKLKAKKVRYSSAAAQQMRKNKVVDKEKKKQATKYATQLYADSKMPGEKNLSAKKVQEIVEKKLGVSVSKRTINKHFAEGRVGTSPKKTGLEGNFDDETVLNLSNAMESYIQIQQLNGGSGDVTYKKLEEF